MNPLRGSRAFPKAVRVRKRREFLAVQRQGRRQHTDGFIVLQSSSPTPNARLGVTVSSRVGNAVVRNRIKRLVREIFRDRRARLAAGVDYVVIAKPGAAQIRHAQAASELDRALGVAARP